ncbi:TPA: hypothetical protein L5D12_000548 [Pseudomonas aeruginosa]|uniref:hypothetical protein n=2 Tax=Gammaproteobacteria TaxID=1236 RepID=UPI00053EE4F6|nr:hypothetical protein [Pseudomonas aeruginosa]AYK25670.1 hypothetical protein PA34_027530 [Pseudomonas aeruginosa]KYO74880.1 hypothetical protein LL05_06403 [Pseudomonas aeruginosa]MCS8376807.1 hypothetical protein [Pseudomonas aeruginosa]MDP5416727.1 hypothetical protein [Pseudomonas aeruginosa]RIZ11058.1 hypothetical protein AXW98_26800 [Pseudomonas aeruginosa]
MGIWKFDENRTDFALASLADMEADSEGCYIIQRGNMLMVREGGHEWPMPERLDIAGVMFDREQFEGSHPLSLREEMERDGRWAREQLQARDRGEVSLPLELPIWVTKRLLDEPADPTAPSLIERLKRWIRR